MDVLYKQYVNNMNDPGDLQMTQFVNKNILFESQYILYLYIVVVSLLHLIYWIYFGTFTCTDTVELRYPKFWFLPLSQILRTRHQISFQ